MVCCMCHACVLLCWTLCNPWTTAHQVPLSTGFFSQEYWSRLPFPPPGDLIDLGIKPRSPALAGGFLSIEPPGKPFMLYILPPYIYIYSVCSLFFLWWQYRNAIRNISLQVMLSVFKHSSATL